MKVVRNKILKSIKGKGGKGEVDNLNMSLMAPISGEFLQSREFVKSLDLICEGPIEGIVDSNGSRVNGQDVLKGIYLNDTPIMTSLITFQLIIDTVEKIKELCQDINLL
jgi:hypothetical protein